MSTYYPKTMKHWNHIRNHAFQSNTVIRKDKIKSSTRSIIHTHNTSPNNHQKADNFKIINPRDTSTRLIPAARMSGGFKIANRYAISNSITPLNSRCHSQEQRPHTKSVFFSRSTKGNHLKTLNSSYTKQHQQRKNQAFDNMKSLGIAECLVTKRQEKLLQSQDKSKIKIVPFVGDMKEGQDPFTPYKRQTQSKQTHLNTCAQLSRQKRSSILVVDTGSKKDFLYLSRRAGVNSLLQKRTRNDRQSRADIIFSFKRVQNKRRKRMQKLQQAKSFNQSITPWNITEKEEIS